MKPLVLSTLLLPLSIAACGDPDPQTTTADGATTVAAVSDAGANPAADSSPRSADAAIQEAGAAADAPRQMIEIRTEEVDEVRPPRIVKHLPQVERPSFAKPGAGKVVSIPTGTLLRGSSPDDLLRDQFAENDHAPTPITAFEIDALPYPNDPSVPFQTDVTREQAAGLCAAAGKRLCTEVEWEWACRGTDNRRYPTGNYHHATDYPVDDPTAPSSPLGVFAMGRLLEWTASQWGRDPDQIERAALRGYTEHALTAGEPVTDEAGRRCAKRWHQVPEAAQADLGFRCCRGDINTETCFIEGPRPAHSLYNNMKPDKFERVIKSIPELFMIHDNPHMFSDADVRAVLARRDSDREELAKQGIHFRWKPVRWIPRQGMELWLAVGRSNRHSFIVALHEVEDNEVYVHASSLILYNQTVPLALVYRRGHRDQVWWAPCWNCRDGGTVEYDPEKNEVIITHKW